MNSAINFVRTLLSNPFTAFALLGFMSFSALAIAFSAEAFLSLEPCVLCVYQRYPFALGLALALIGFGVYKNTKFAPILLITTGLGFLVNSGIALYQSGVQLQWWSSGIDACSVNFFMEDASKQSILKNLMSAPMASCDEIQWADPILGLTIANYNVVFCLGLFLVSMLAAYLVTIGKKKINLRSIRYPNRENRSSFHVRSLAESPCRYFAAHI